MAAGLASALACVGCGGQTIEGAWQGALPLDGASACTVKLYVSDRFEATCGPKGPALAGSYSWDGSELRLTSDSYVFEGKKAVSKPTFEYRVEGHGNHLTLLRDRERWEWVRLSR